MTCVNNILFKLECYVFGKYLHFFVNTKTELNGMFLTAYYISYSAMYLENIDNNRKIELTKFVILDAKVLCRGS